MIPTFTLGGLTDPGLGGAAFSPASLYGASEPGFAIDLSSAPYTDSARTTMATAASDPIGSVTDLSGNGKHPAASAGARPLWQTDHADFNGSSHCLRTPAIDFGTCSAITIVVGVRKDSDATNLLCELGPDLNANNGSIYVLSSTGAGAYTVAAKGTSPGFGTSAASSNIAAPDTCVITAIANIATPTTILRRNGAQVAADTTSLGAGFFRNDVFNIGARNAASFFLDGGVYRMIVIGRQLTAGELANAEAWCGAPFT